MGWNTGFVSSSRKPSASSNSGVKRRSNPSNRDHTDSIGGSGESQSNESTCRTSNGQIAKRPRADSDSQSDIQSVGRDDLNEPMDVAVGPRDSQGLKWHLRLNHVSKKYLEIAAKVVPELKGIKFGSEVLDCADCRRAKAKRQPCKEKRSRSDKPFS